MANPNPNRSGLKNIQKGQVLNPNGRPKRQFTEAKELGFTKDDVIACYKLYIAKTQQELDEILKDKNISVLEVIIIKAIKSDISDGKMDNIEKILNRGIGTPKLENTNTNLNIDANSEQEVDKDKLIELKKILNKIEE